MVYTDEMLEKIGEVLENEDVRRALQDAANAEEIVKVFAEQGVELDLDAAQVVAERVRKFKDDGELTEEEMELVAGGRGGWKKFWNGCKAVAATAIGCVVGGGITAASGGTGVVGGVMVGSAIACGLIAKWCD